VVSGLFDGRFGAIAILMIDTASIAEFFCHVAANNIRNSAIDGGGGVVVKVNHRFKNPTMGVGQQRFDGRVWQFLGGGLARPPLDCQIGVGRSPLSNGGSFTNRSIVMVGDG